MPKVCPDNCASNVYRWPAHALFALAVLTKAFLGIRTIQRPAMCRPEAAFAAITSGDRKKKRRRRRPKADAEAADR